MRHITIKNAVLGSLVSLAAACGGGPDSADPDVGPHDQASTDRGPSSDMAPAATSCPSMTPKLTNNSSISVSSPNLGGANPQRDYCLVLASTSSAVRLELKGGDCNNGNCLGDDLQLYLKAGDVPNAFEPDSSTTQWTYTPGDGSFGTFTKPGSAGVWFLSLLDDPTSLGYSNVTLTLRP
jgi:hypothetical protein